MQNMIDIPNQSIPIPTLCNYRKSKLNLTFATAIDTSDALTSLNFANNLYVTDAINESIRTL